MKYSGGAAAGEDVPIVWNGRRATAFMPALLVDRDLELDAVTASRAAFARAEVERSAEVLGIDHAPLARLLLRSEGLASSFIEGLRVPVAEVVLAEDSMGGVGDPNARWVAAALDASDIAIAAAMGVESLSVSDLCRWHRALMAGSPIPADLVGRVRDAQGWIGGTSPFDAHLVTPPPDRLPALLDDLLRWVDRGDLDPITQAAVAHAQFEIIHPFADGNGRIGRMLVAWILTRRCALMAPPPVSVAIAADVGGYASGLVRFRMGDHPGWIRWFADAVAEGGRVQRALSSNIDALLDRWTSILDGAKVRNHSAARSILPLLVRGPVITATVIARELGVAHKTAIGGLHRLVDLGVLDEMGTVAPVAAGQPARTYVARDLLALIGSTPVR